MLHCKETVEDVDYLILHCGLTMRLWWYMFRWFNTPLVIPRSMKELMLSWKSGRRRKKQRAWNMVLIALMWVVWRERNRRAFEGAESSFLQLKCSLRSLVFFWYKQKVPHCIEDWVDFVEDGLFV